MRRALLQETASTAHFFTAMKQRSKSLRAQHLDFAYRYNARIRLKIVLQPGDSLQRGSFRSDTHNEAHACLVDARLAPEPMAASAFHSSKHAAPSKSGVAKHVLHLTQRMRFDEDLDLGARNKLHVTLPVNEARCAMIERHADQQIEWKGYAKR